MENLSQSFGVSPAVWDHSVICQPTQVNAPSSTIQPYSYKLRYK